MSTLRVDRIEPYLSSSVSIEGAIQANAATTGSNTFVGDQNIQGTITASIAEGFALVGGVGNISTLVATSSFGGGGSGFPFTGDAVITGSLLVTGSTTIIGELNTTPALLPETPPAGFQRYIIPILSGSNNTIARDVNDSIYWQPLNNGLTISASAGNSAISPSQIAITNGSFNTSGLFPTYIRNRTENGKFIGISGDPSLTGFSSVTNPAIILQSGSVGEFDSPQYYTPIEFQSSQSFSDGRVTVTTPLVGLQGAEFTGSVGVSGVVTQNVTAPGTDEVIPFIRTTGATVNSKSYNQVGFFLSDLPSFGTEFQDYFAIEYYDSTNYAFGSEININGSTARIASVASGSGQASFVKTIDNYNGTSQVTLESPNKIAINGKAELSNVMQLAQLNPLPAGADGQLAVSASNLYFFSGSNWNRIAFA